MSTLRWINVGLRALVLEAGIVAALAYWGFQAGPNLVAKVFLAVASPAIGFGVWGAIDFRFAGRYAEALRLGEELLISGLAALALATAGQPLLGVALALVSVAHHGLLYALGDRLLKPVTA